MSTQNAMPELCYIALPSDPDVIGIVKLGEMGYTPYLGMTREAADEKNGIMEVTHAVREAMLTGSLFGWHVSGAKPENCTFARSLVEEYGPTVIKKKVKA